MGINRTQLGPTRSYVAGVICWRPWSGPGATGSSDRGGLLDSKVVNSGSKITWNITSAMQDSMRSNKSLDLLLDVLPGQPNTNAIFYSPMTTNTDNLPTIEIIYSPGSNIKPIPPSALTCERGMAVCQ